MESIPLFDQNMNFILLCMQFDNKKGTVNLSERRAVASEVDMRRYKPDGLEFPQLLDNTFINATSPQDYFEIMTTCASQKNQPKNIDGKPSKELQPLFMGKSTFFHSTREKRGVSDSRHIRLTIAGGLDFTLADLSLVFNLGSLALFSIPAYLVMDSKGGFYPAPGQRIPIGRWLYDLHAPGRSIKNFEDYYDAFIQGVFLQNNSDVFLTTYGLAHAIAVFAEDIKNYEAFDRATSFRDFTNYEPLLYVLDNLIRIGALHDPFGSAPVWKICPTGIENAQEVNPALLATLQLTETLAPIMTAPISSASVLQVFYGLIAILPLKEYFSIDRQIKFEFPFLDESYHT